MIAQQPKISVIIPVYNVERFLGKCLDSVISQPLKDVEIICVNDGSTDRSPQILDEYAKKDERVKVIHQPNMSSGTSRNTGLEAATGEFVHFLDSDDFLLGNAYEELYEISAKNKLDILLFKAAVVDAFTEEPVTGPVTFWMERRNELLENAKEVFSFKQRAEELTTNSVTSQSTHLYNRDFLMKNNLRFENICFFDDHLFYYTSMAKAERMMGIKKDVFAYRTNNPKSLHAQHVKKSAHIINTYNVINEATKHLPHKEQALILNDELRTVFYYHGEAKRQGKCSCRTRKNMNKFVLSLDVEHIKAGCTLDNYWYSEYLKAKKTIEKKKPYKRKSSYKKNKRCG